MSSPSSTQTPIIFISYRRGDAAGYSYLLQRELGAYFGDDRVFIDINIKPGDDWGAVIEAAVRSCEALVAVIGKEWLTVKIGNMRRIDDPKDLLRLEIVTALNLNKKVFPLLVEGASMPQEEDLPGVMSKLARQQATEVRYFSWKYDFGRLITALDESVNATKRDSAVNENLSDSHGPRERQKQVAFSSGNLLRQFRRRGVNYWLRALVLIALGIFVGDWLGRQNIGSSARSGVFRVLQQLRPRSSFPQHTVVVLIGDEEYWSSGLEGRVPIRRDYLAQLVRQIDYAGPSVIALDFDLRSPSPGGNPVEHPSYQYETSELLATLKEVSRRETVVLPKTIGAGEEQSFIAESDIYNGFDFDGGKVQTGFAMLPDDVERLPMHLMLADGTLLNSFAVAIVRAYDPQALAGIRNYESVPPYASYLSDKDFQTISANAVLDGSHAALGTLRNKIVIVGGAWHTYGRGRGPVINSFETPVGRIGGVFIHANYVEAILDHRTYSPGNDRYLVFIEVVLALIVALIFSLEIQPQFKIGTIVLLSILLIVASYVSWQTLNLLFSFWVPVIFLAGSLLVDQIQDWRTLALARIKEG